MKQNLELGCESCPLGPGTPCNRVAGLAIHAFEKGGHMVGDNPALDPEIVMTMVERSPDLGLVVVAACRGIREKMPSPAAKTTEVTV